jgi:hypothetical protein
MDSWTCTNGHLNEGSRLACAVAGCEGTPRTGGNPLAFFGWILLLFTAPVYPLAGGLSLGAFFGVGLLGREWELPEALRLLAMILATLAGFFVGFRLERACSKFTFYRVLRDLVRLVAGVAVVATGVQTMKTENALGILVLVPIVLVLLKRLDRLTGVGKPQPPAAPVAETAAAADTTTRTVSRQKPLWLEAILERSQTAVALGFGGAVIGFFLGGVIGALLGWVLVSATILVLVGTFALMGALDARLGGAILRGVVGAVSGAVIWGLMHRLPNDSPAPAAMAEGALGGALILIVGGFLWRLVRRRAPEE